MAVDDLKQHIREVPDFPKPGIHFYDVATLFRNAAAFRSAVQGMAEAVRPHRVDALAGIEARGFVLAAALARELDLGLILVRKLGKLPGATERQSYELEYGEAQIEVQREAVAQGQRIAVVDDLLATGGTAEATGQLIRRMGGRLAAYAFMVELDFLEGRRRLGDDLVLSLLHYA